MKVKYAKLMMLNNMIVFVGGGRCYFVNPTSQNVQTWVMNLQSELEGDSTVNKSEIVVLPKQIFGQT